MTSNWQLAGPYAAAGVALAWNAWLTWHQRHHYGLTVSWRVPTESEQVLGQRSFGGETPVAVVEIYNAGDSVIYDVQSATNTGVYLERPVPTAQAGELVATVTVRRAAVEDTTDTPAVRLTYITRPHSSRRRAAHGRVPVSKDHPLWLTPETRRYALRDRLARAISPSTGQIRR